MAQTWETLLFAHWSLPASDVARFVPDGLVLDTWERRAWIGLTPFVLSGLRLRGLPALPRISRFPELNVRTYVTRDGKPGILFFSLDAASRLAVEGARGLFRLPYYRASMAADRTGRRMRYRSRRVDRRGRSSDLLAEYEPTGAARNADPGTLEYFLAERYCLYTKSGGLLRTEIHHPPWPLQPAEASFARNSMAPAGLTLPDEPPLLHYAERQDVLVWRPRRVL
jgi:uncharacterized protein YqjF (DUF2071 family)